jgi:hypothetical protein
MKSLLQQYLVEHQTLPLPGIGVLQSHAKPAAYEVVGRSFQPPTVEVNFAPVIDGESMPLQHLVGFIAVKKNIAEEKAYELLQQYVIETNLQLKTKSLLSWDPIGSFEQQDDGNKRFSPSIIRTGFSPMVAERVIREGASHEMMVGDKATTTAQMEAYLAETEEATDRWWLLPLLIALGAIAIIIWHYATSLD